MRKEEDGTKRYRKSSATLAQSRRAPAPKQFDRRLEGKWPHRKALPPTPVAAASLTPLYTAAAPSWPPWRASSKDAAR